MWQLEVLRAEASRPRWGGGIRRERKDRKAGHVGHSALFARVSGGPGIIGEETEVAVDRSLVTTQKQEGEGMQAFDTC